MKITLKISEESFIALGACKANANNSAIGCIGMIFC